ncbi:MAG: PH domain-containing protein [Candidatus Saccharibacteria bacterium]|nr:MAG: PH domain-containing protein [Candidatus Saccharibacteria bacterium]
MKVSVDQSAFGRKYNYGTITIHMKEQQDEITFRHIKSPESARRTAQAKFVQSSKHKLL